MYINLPHCQIRSFQETDAKSLAHHANNINIWRNLRDGFPHPYTVADAQRFIQMAHAAAPERFFAIATAQEAIGSIGFTPGQDVERFSAEFGYWLAEPYWNRGIMTEVIGAFTRFIFKNYRINRLFATPFGHNSISTHILEKAGYTLEGHLRSAAFKDGVFVDKYLYAKIDDSFKP